MSSVSEGLTLPRSRQLLITGGVAGALLLVVVASTIFHTADPDPAATEATPGVFQATPQQFAGLSVQRVGRPGEGAAVHATGIISTNDDVSTPIVPPLTGQVVKVLVEPGQTVREGQPLAVIRSTERSQARDALVTASAQRENARAQVRVAEGNAHRQELIFKNGGGAQKDTLQAQADLVAAQATLRTAEAAYATAADQLKIQGGTAGDLRDGAKSDAGGALATVRAPIGGVVASRSLAAGQYLGSGQTNPIFVITNPASVWLIAQVAEGDARHVHVGDRLDVTTPSSPGRTFSARVSVVGSGLDPATHRLPVRAVIANPDGALKPQMFANFTIRPQATDNTFAGVQVPAEAVIREGDAARVWVAQPGNRLVARDVKIADGAADGQVNIISGLKPGELIVTSGAIFVNEAGIPS